MSQEKSYKLQAIFQCLILSERLRNMRRNFHSFLSCHPFGTPFPPTRAACVHIHKIWHAVCVQPFRQAGCCFVPSCT